MSDIHTPEQKLTELVELCKAMLASDDDETGKPLWSTIYAIEDKLKELGYLP